VHVFTREPLDILEKSGLTFQQAYWCLWGAAIAVIIGHMFPVWLGFRGGKGVATGVGVFLIMTQGAGCVCRSSLYIDCCGTRYVSLGSIIAALTIPLFILLQNLISPSLYFAPVITAATAGRRPDHLCSSRQHWSMMRELESKIKCERVALVGAGSGNRAGRYRGPSRS